MRFNCPFKNLCRFCNDYFFKICCLKQTYSEGDFKICKEIGKCPNLYLCQNTLNGKLTRMALFYNIIPDLEDIKKFDYIVKVPFENLEMSFIPRIEVYGNNSKNQIEIIKKLGINTIAISLGDLISNQEKEIIKQDFKRDLHEKLNFNGNILLQTNIQDYYCIKIMENINNYVDALNYLKPDIITTFDANFYLDQPLFISSIQAMRILEANVSISKINIPQIFLLPPAPLDLFKCIFEVFLKSNHTTICIPLAEFSKSKNRYALKLIKHVNFYKDISEKKFKILLISKNPDKRMNANCYSSLTWAKFKEDKLKKNRYEEIESILKKTIKKSRTINRQISLFSFFKRGN